MTTEGMSVSQLRSQVVTMVSQLQPPVYEYEDIVTGVDYLPLYRDQAGKLSFNGVRVKVTFTEPRLKPRSGV